MKTYMRANREEPDSVFHRLAEEKKKYEDIKYFYIKQNLPVALGEGALIFDEVKVSASIYWNSKSNKFVGHLPSLGDNSSLHDIYQEINPSCKIKIIIYSSVSKARHYFRNYMYYWLLLHRRKMT